MPCGFYLRSTSFVVLHAFKEQEKHGTEKAIKKNLLFVYDRESYNGFVGAKNFDALRIHLCPWGRCRSSICGSSSVSVSDDLQWNAEAKEANFAPIRAFQFGCEHLTTSSGVCVPSICYLHQWYALILHSASGHVGSQLLCRHSWCLTEAALLP